jgi:hypothetical protein
MKKWLPLIVSLLIVGAVTFGSSIKSWASGEALTASDLNANFSHIHTTMVGGHGARLVNADVSATASISHSKMETPALLPKGTWNGSAACTSGMCSGTGYGKLASVERTALGAYKVSFTTTLTDTSYTVLAAWNSAGAHADTVCMPATKTTTAYYLSCYSHAAAASDDVTLDIVLFDNNN